MPSADTEALVAQARSDCRLTLLLDYDGTLVPYTTLPDMAAPDAEVLALLSVAATRLPGRVHIVSGRGRDVLNRWLGALSVDLWAEHALWHRPYDGSRWETEAGVDVTWMTEARALLEHFRIAMPGALVETKSCALAWHYRLADPDRGAACANELRQQLTAMLPPERVQVLEGHRVLEVRPRQANKGRAVRHALTANGANAMILAIGDDKTDEDMFAALPASGVAIRVASKPTVTGYRLPDHRAVRAFLQRVLA